MGLAFVPTLDPPNRVPHGRFSLQLGDGVRFRLLGCRQGLLLIFLASRRLTGVKSQYQLLVWDPVTGDQRRIAFPPRLDAERTCPINGAVLRGAGEAHFQFQVVLVVADNNRDKQITRMLAWVYSSETGAWGDLISTPLPSMASILTVVYPHRPAVLIGGSLYWLLFGGSSDILEFDLGRQSLAVIPLPLAVDMFGERPYLVMRADGGGLGFLSLSGLSVQLWKRKTNSDGVASWVSRRTIELDELLSLNSKDDTVIIGFAEYNNVVLLRTSVGTFMIQFESLQFKKLPETHALCCHYAFESVYTAGTAVGNGHDGAELMHNT